jgi:hypothetical protein
VDEVFLKGEYSLGEYVVIESQENPSVICSHADPVVAYRHALLKGYENPILVHVPEKDSVYVYHAAY